MLFTTTGHAGHLLPLIPFARAAERAGHEVRVAAQHSRVAAIERAGLTAAPFAEPPREAWYPILEAASAVPFDEANAVVVADGFAGLGARAALPDVLALIDAWRPDVVVRETYEFAGPLAAELRGVPLARVGLALEAAEEWTVRLAAPALERMRAELGLPPDPAAAAVRHAPYLTATPAAFEEPGPRGPAAVHRFRTADRAVAGPGAFAHGAADPRAFAHGAADPRAFAHGAADPRAFAHGAADPAAPVHLAGPAGTASAWRRRAPRPLVYVTLGSVASSLPLFPEVYRAVIDALAPLPVRLLVTIGHGADPAALGPLPDNVHVEPWVDQDAVLAHAAAVVCHGGYGSTLGALARGVPVVVVPLFAGDQWLTARRVAAIGAGVALEGAPRGTMEPPGADVLGALPGAVRRVLDEPRHGSAARRIAHAIASLPPAHDSPAVLAQIARGALRAA